MKLDILQTVLNRDYDYFVVETKEYYGSEERYLMFVSLPLEAHDIRQQKELDTITYKEVQRLQDLVIETNIFLKPKYPPFQMNQRPLRNITDIVGLEKVDDLGELLSQDFANMYDVKQYLERKQNTL